MNRGHTSRAGVSIIERAPLMPGAASAVDSAQDLGELRSQHPHVGQLAAALADMVHHATAGLDQLLASWSATSAPPPRAWPVWVVASVASHSISNRSIWLLEDAARSSPSRPTISHDGIARKASAGALMTRAGRADCGDLRTPLAKVSA